LLVGSACWAAFAVVAVALNGVVMDEATVPAQIISGAVKYPGGHPHDIYYKTVYSFTHVAAAGFLSLWNSDLALSAVRNWLFLTLSLVTPFAVTLALTRRASWGHVAAALTLLGGHLLYQGVYPMWVFPNYYSQGHVGMHLALLAGALIVARVWRAGGLLAGMMPAMHAAMALTVWPWLAGYLLLRRITGGAVIVPRLLAGLGIGVLFSVGVAFLIPLISGPAAPVAPYDTLAGADLARAGFQAFTDAHRLEPGFMTRGYLLNPVAFLALSYVLLWATRSSERTSTERSVDVVAILGLGFCSMAIVYGVWVVQAVFGGLPEIVAMAMPWRFSNVTATLLVPVSVAAIAALIARMDERDALVARTVVALMVAVFGVAMGGLLGFSGRLAVERQMLAVLWGLPFGLGLWVIRSTPGRMGHLLLPMMGIMTAAAPFWGDSKAALYLAVATTACVIAASAGRLLAAGAPGRLLSRTSSLVMTAAIVACAAGMLTARVVDASNSSEVDWDRISTDDVTIDRWLAENAGADEPVLAAIYPRVELQAKARQPVLLELETLFLMTYLPNLAPQIGTMVRDLYGVDYEQADAVARQCRSGLVRPWCQVWTDAWKGRTRDQWIELARKYRFRFVVAPAEFGVDLPMRLQTARANVYEIPHVVEANTH
jgi:hypothetical protein